MSSIAPTLQLFFTERMVKQLQASPRTVVSYRDTCRLLLRFVADRTGKAPSALGGQDVDAELISLKCGDVELGASPHVHCTGKGRKERCVPLTATTVAVMRVWLHERAGRGDEPLFPTRTGRRLSDDAVERRVATHKALASHRCPSLRSKKLTPHVLRHTSAMSLLHAGVDVAVIALWLGHADIRSTDAYLHADLTIKERALARTTPATAKPGRYQAPDRLLAFLES